MKMMHATQEDARGWGRSSRGLNMLRVNVQYDAATTRFNVEGSLVWPWVEELERCLQEQGGTRRDQSIEVNLVDVTFVDDSGRDLLVNLHERGVNLVAHGLMTQAIVEEIVNRKREEECDVSHGPANS
jgi:hypothetical protein